MKLAKPLMATAAAVSALMVMSTGAFAEDAASSPYGSFGGNVTFTNDYVFRGYSLTNEHPAIQGSLTWSHPSGFFAGVWGSNLSNSGDNLELDWSAGYSGSLDKFSYSATIVYYTYPWSNASDEYWEGIFQGGYDFGFMSADLGVGYSPKQSNLGHDDATWFYGDVNVPIPMSGSFSPYLFAHLGHQSYAFGVPGGYWEWNGGAGFSLLGLDIKAMYIDTNVKATPTADSRFVFTVGKSF
jgi:uncharacterized protein (TIGR02001 family)